MKNDSNQTIWSWSKLSGSKDSISLRTRRQERGQARLPDLRGSLSGSVDPRLESLSIKNYRHCSDHLMVGKVGLPPLLTPATQAD